MNDQQPSQGGDSPAASGAQPAARPLAPGPLTVQSARRQMAIWGGILAGLGIGIGFAFLMHVIQQASPNYGQFSIGGSVWGVLLLAGPVFGLGLGLALAALIPALPVGPGEGAEPDEPDVQDQGTGAKLAPSQQPRPEWR